MTDQQLLLPMMTGNNMALPAHRDGTHSNDLRGQPWTELYSVCDSRRRIGLLTHERYRMAVPEHTEKKMVVVMGRVMLSHVTPGG
jgi:hypothetical protein